MEKYSQFRDRGSGISPFMPISTPTSTLSTILHSLVFLFRLPVFLLYAAVYFLLLHHLPVLPVVARKLLLWGLMGIPGIWWVDLQLDGVKRGSLARQPPSRVPHPRSVIAANFTSPIDALYLAAVFDPVFTVSYPGTRRVRRVGLVKAVALALSPSPTAPPSPEELASGAFTDLRALLARYPDRVIAVFPECGATNGQGILPFSPSLLAVPSDAPIFPVSIRYTPADITTPVPGAWLAFLWNLLSRPTHCIRVRIAEPLHNATGGAADTDEYRPVNGGGGRGKQKEKQQQVGKDEVGGASGGDEAYVSPEEQRVLDKVAEALARLGRNKRVGLTVRDKAAFVEAWKRGRK